MFHFWNDHTCAVPVSVTNKFGTLDGNNADKSAETCKHLSNLVDGPLNPS